MERKGKSEAKMGEGGKERVTAEEGIPGLDVRGKVYTALNDGPSGLLEPFWVVQIGAALSGVRRVDTHRLLNRHYSPPVINILCATLDMQPSGQLYPLTSALFLSSSWLGFVIDACFQRLLWNDAYARRIRVFCFKCFI